MMNSEYARPWDDDIWAEAYGQLWSVDCLAEHPLSEAKSRVLDLAGLDVAEQ